jgi:hypothetical protein
LSSVKIAAIQKGKHHMQNHRLARRSVQTILAAICLAAISGRAMADDKYTLRENVHPGQTSKLAVSSDFKVKSTSTTNGKADVTDSETGHSWKLTLTILAVKNGSATHSLVAVDPDSFDTTQDAGADAKKTPCPFGGKSVNLIRHFDESLTDDFQGEAGPDDTDLIDSLIQPDQQNYPDHPVAVGDTWDNTAGLAKYETLGPKDKFTSKAQLDWVKTIDGKQLAQITDSIAIVYQEDGNVEEDQEITMTNLVDLATGTIIKSDQKGTSKYVTPPTEATQVTGGTEFTFHAELVPDAKPATQP